MTEAYRLPTLSARRAELETCGYCPKLCRAACPVSNAEPRETITPWGKMSAAWFAARGLVPIDAVNAAVAWACTGCFACRERCDHKNPVAETLGDARAGFFAAGVAPAAAMRVASEFDQLLDAEASGRAPLERLPGVRADAPTALVLGCGYTRWHPEEASDAIRAAVGLLGSVRLARGCCGAPLLYAGDRAGFLRARASLLESIGTAERCVVVDPGCARILAERRPITLVEIAARELGRLGRVPDLGPNVRWHDPCKLGRGLGIYEAPRLVLTAALGRAPQEFDRRRDGAACSGAGGMLPSSMPEDSRQIADDRLEEHRRLGGGTLVTACASSLRRFRSRGGRVLDLATVIARSLNGRAGP
jgi:dimethylglycine catabolism B